MPVKRVLLTLNGVAGAGLSKKVLIELQKSKGSLDIDRFRRYLGSNDSQDDAAIAAAAGISLEQVRALRLNAKKP